MDLHEYFPIWNQLSRDIQSSLLSNAVLRKIKKGTVIHSADSDCTGLLLVKSGQLRAYIANENGKEITVYRLAERDICLFTASCIMRSIQFDITVSAEKDSEVWVIPASIYQSLMEKSVAIANYTNEIMGMRFTEVIWLIEQIIWKSFDKRLAGFLLEESNFEESERLNITHEQIAAHLGTAREVVTRMLKYFSEEGLVHLARGTIEITNSSRLCELAK
ncbi:MAG: Crp/Fnr family transcriptional regulator [Clostridiales bacterium]|nr:Crp/Fnr family transcriptional regulator [Clostridiales bacterium]